MRSVGAPRMTGVMDLLNPFLPTAGTAKYPSVGSSNTIAEGYRCLIPITSDASGQACIGFDPMAIGDLSNYYACTIAAGNWTPVPAAYPARTSTLFRTMLLADPGVQCRMNSFGLRIFSTASMTAASGSVQIGVTSSNILEMGTIAAYAPRLFTTYEVHPMSHGCEYSVVVNPLDFGAHDFKDYAANGGASLNDDLPNFESVLIQWAGLPASTSVGYVEVYSNYEFSVGNHALSKIATPSPIVDASKQHALDTARHSATRVLKGGASKVAEHYERKLLGWAAKQAVNRFAPPGTKALMDAGRHAMEVD